MSDFWIEDPTREQRLREMVQIPGMSARAIGVALGCSRNAVISKVRRTNLQFTNKVGQYFARLGPEAPKPIAQMPKPERQPETSVLTIFRQARPPKPPAPVEVYGPFRAVPIWDLRDADCRAIVEGDPSQIHDMRYCGAPALPDKSWCVEHFKQFTTTPAAARAERTAEHGGAEVKRSVGRWS